MLEATITTDGRKIMARIPYANGRGPKLAKQVPGARADWDKTVSPNVFRGWLYPLSMDTCRSFRKVFGDGLTVLPPLVAWSRTAVTTERKLEELREERLDSVSFLRLAAEAPELYAAMRNRPYQIAGMGFLLTSRAAILADDPGLGKTLQTLGALIESNATEILVACKRTAVRTVWERETMRWTGIETFVAQGSRPEREKAMAEYAAYDRGRKMLIINIEMVRAKREEICLSKEPVCPQTRGQKCNHEYKAIPDWPFLFGRKWDAMVFDESHNLLASTANYQSKRITQARFGAVKLRKQLRPDGLAIALSGTPFRSKLEKGWGTLNWLDDSKFGSYWRWAEQHFGVENGRYGKIVGGTDADGKPLKVLTPRDDSAWDKMLRPFYLKRTKKEAAPDLPPMIFAGTPIAGPDSPCYVQIEMLPEQEKIYRQMELDAEATVEGRKVTATGVLAEITRRRQFANSSVRLGEGRTLLPGLPSNKLEWITDFMAEREDTDGKVVIASSFSEMVELTARTLRAEGWEVLTLTGAASDRERSDLVARFQDPNDPLRVVVINRLAGGESITLDAADEMVIIDEPWISDQDEQLTARIHRVSRIHQVTIYRLVSSGTIDEDMAALTDDQRAALATASPRKLSEILLEGKP
jgi:SNF2 family DNA or RNA helicase